MRLTQTTPDISIVSIKLEDTLEILNSFVEVFLCSEDATDGIHRGNGSWVGTKRMLVCDHSLIEIAHQFGKAP